MLFIPQLFFLNLLQTPFPLSHRFMKDVVFCKVRSENPTPTSTSHSHPDNLVETYFTVHFFLCVVGEEHTYEGSVVHHFDDLASPRLGKNKKLTETAGSCPKSQEK